MDLPDRHLHPAGGVNSDWIRDPACEGLYLPMSCWVDSDGSEVFDAFVLRVKSCKVRVLGSKPLEPSWILDATCLQGLLRMIVVGAVCGGTGGSKVTGWARRASRHWRGRWA